MIFLILSVIVFGIILFLDNLVPDEKERPDVFADNNDPAVDCHRKFCLLSDDLFKQLCAIDGSAAQDTICNLYTWDFATIKFNLLQFLNMEHHQKHISCMITN